MNHSVFPLGFSFTALILSSSGSDFNFRTKPLQVRMNFSMNFYLLLEFLNFSPSQTQPIGFGGQDDSILFRPPDKRTPNLNN